MRSVVVGTAGHIDHGKSALVWALTGSDPDRLEEEKARGITIDLGFAHWTGGDTSFAFVDVPGHERFVKNMLAGVGGIDLVLMVVAADESVMPQTREHFEICRLLRIPAGLVAITKADLVDQETLELVRLEVRELVAQSFLRDAPIVPVSSRSGAGLDELRAALIDLGRRLPGRIADGAARLPIDRAFTVHGFGTVVTGTLVSGGIGVDDELELLPSKRTVKVRGLQVHGRQQNRAAAGQRVAVNLGGLDLDQVARGDTLAAPGALEAVRRLDVVIELVAGARPLEHGGRVRFHQGTSEVLGRVALIGPAPGGRPRREHAGGGDAPTEGSRALAGGERAYARLRLEAPAALTRGDRFILRAYSPPVTIGGGEVLDPEPPRAGVRTRSVRCRLESIDPTGAADWSEATERAVLAMIGEAGLAGVTSGALARRVGLAGSPLGAVTERLAKAGLIAQVGSAWVACAALDGAGRDLLAAVDAHHKAEPLSGGLPREEARVRLFARAPSEVFERVLTDLVEAHAIEARDRLALPGHQVSLTREEARVHEALERLYREAGLKPPEGAALPGLISAPPAATERMTHLLVRQKVLVRVDTLTFHREALAALRQDVASMKAAGGSGEARVDVASFKSRYGVTRKFAIPLLEYLDRERVTRRVGDSRIVL